MEQCYLQVASFFYYSDFAATGFDAYVNLLDGSHLFTCDMLKKT